MRSACFLPITPAPTTAKRAGFMSLRGQRLVQPLAHHRPRCDDTEKSSMFLGSAQDPFLAREAKDPTAEEVDNYRDDQQA